MANLNNCLHCGSAADYYEEGNGAVFIKCTNISCALRTPSMTASIEYGARDRITAIWNAEAGGLEYPAWVQPTGAHDAYGYGAKVQHAGKQWVSNMANNVWEPGISGWREA